MFKIMGNNFRVRNASLLGMIGNADDGDAKDNAYSKKNCNYLNPAEYVRSAINFK